MNEFALFAMVGLLAQLIDGGLGMGYGIVSATVLLALGSTPAAVSASTHAAELFTTAVSSGAHLLHRNVDFRIFWRLMPAGVIGGVIGAYILTGVNGEVTRPYVVPYLGIMGVLILRRAFGRQKSKPISTRATGLYGIVGGFCDAVGGGGWGPVVTSAMLAQGGEPRYVIGSVNASEFLVTMAISATFVVTLVSGHWERAGSLLDYATPVAGLVTGGIIAAPIASFLAKYLPARRLLAGVGLLVLALTTYQGWLLFA
ncbi:MAG TPA: sulfite exporter TauE/SafE family protein [Micropepsaceae bacterium]|jgi:hypothetical protein